MPRAAPEPLQNMGRPEPRIDGALKVTGAARYPSDFMLEEPAFAFLVTSSISKGRIQSMDVADAKAVPGVLLVLTHENAGDLKSLPYAPSGGGPSTSIQDLGPDIRHDGQIVAMVVAETFEAAREAAYRVRVDYRAETPSATFDAKGLSDEPVKKDLPSAGDADAAFEAAAVKLDATYVTPPQHHNPIELFTTTCLWRGDELTVYEPSQFVYGLKNSLASRVGTDPAKIRILSPFVGGAFGSKAQMTPRTGLVALAAKRLNRPVKLVASRDQGFTINTYRAETRHHIRMGAERSGRIASLIHEGWEVTSRPDAYSVSGVDDSGRLYNFGTLKTAVTMLHADRNTPGFMRSPSVVPYVYALESAMDELAVKLEMDPVALRLANDSDKDTTGKPWSSRSLKPCYEQAAARFGWERRTPRPGSMRDGDWLIGWGCATAVYPTHVGTNAARVRLFASGEAQVEVAAHDIGTGAYTVLGQIAAERLGIPLAKVKVELGDSSLPPAIVAGGSSTTASAGSAVLKACDAILAKLTRPAPGVTVGAARPGADWAQIEQGLKRLNVGAVEEYAEFVPPGAPDGAMKDLYEGKPFLTGGSKGDSLMYAFGAEFVEVRIHALTREIRVPRMVGAFAGGRIVNTRTARSQLMGGMVWGVSSALHEATEIDPRNARYINDNLADYLVPVNADINEIDVLLVSETDDKVNPAGVKGLGELGNVGTAAAVANAVYHATGVRVRDLPIRLEKILSV